MEVVVRDPAVSYDRILCYAAAELAKSSKTREERHKYLCESLSRDLSTNAIRCKQQTTSNSSPLSNNSLHATTENNT